MPQEYSLFDYMSGLNRRIMESPVTQALPHNWLISKGKELFGSDFRQQQLQELQSQNKNYVSTAWPESVARQPTTSFYANSGTAWPVNQPTQPSAQQPATDTTPMGPPRPAQPAQQPTRQPRPTQPSFFDIIGSMMQIAPNMLNMTQRFLPGARGNNTPTQPAQQVQQPDQVRMAEAENQRRMIELMGLLGEQEIKGGKLTKAPDMMGTLNARAEQAQAERERLLGNYAKRQAQI